MLGIRYAYDSLLISDTYVNDLFFTAEFAGRHARFAPEIAAEGGLLVKA